MIKILCSYCNKQLADDDATCPSCGTLKVSADGMVLTSRGLRDEEELIDDPEDGDPDDEPTAFTCKHCAKAYKTESGRDRHEAKCPKE